MRNRLGLAGGWRRHAVLGAVTLLALTAGSARSEEPGRAIWGTGQFVEYVPGTAPVIITSPHGGLIEPPSVADRTWGVLGGDGRTQDLAREIVEAIARRRGRRPHLVVNTLHRKKLDANREIGEAAQGDPAAELAWTEYHGFVEAARATVVAQHGAGLLLDVHGHTHPEALVELGYALSAGDLGRSDTELNDPLYAQRSTIRSLASRSGAAFSEVLRGPTSLGGVLEELGFATVPSPSNPDPGGGAYFTGGYTARRHGSSGGGTIDAVQVESPRYLRHDTLLRRQYADAMAEAVDRLLTTHAGLPPAGEPRVILLADHPEVLAAGGKGRFRLVRSGDVVAARTVSLVSSGAAVAGRDHVPLPAEVTFAAGATTAFVDVVPIDDPAATGNRALVLSLDGGVEIGDPSRATMVLLHDTEDRLELDWRFEETTGDVALDASGQGRDGVYLPDAFAGPGVQPDSPAGNARQFDELDDVVEAADFPYAPAGALTLSFRFRLAPDNGDTERRYVFSHGGPTSEPDTVNVFFDEASGELGSLPRYGNEYVPWQLAVDIDFRDEQWHCYALVSAPGELTRTYVDGQAMNVNFVGGDSLDPVGPISFGGHTDRGAASFYGGDLDELAVRSEALAAEEIIRLCPEPVDVRLLRGVAGALASGWTDTHLPLSFATDAEDDTWPLTVAPPGTVEDAAPPAGELVLYRLLLGPGLDTGNRLRLVRSPAGLTASY